MRGGLGIIKFIKIVDETKIVILIKKNISFLNAAIINMIDLVGNKIWPVHMSDNSIVYNLLGYIPRFNLGDKSYPTEKLTVDVKQPKFLQIGTFALSVAAVLVPLLALILILLFTAWYIWRRFVTLRKHLGREVGEVETTLHKAFNALRQSI